MHDPKEMKKRAELINEFIEFLSKQERGFFKGQKGIAKFSIKKGTVHYTSEHKGICKPVRIEEELSKMEWVGHGSTMTGQIADFAKFIWTGDYILLNLYYSGISYENQLKIHIQAYNKGIIDYPSFYFHDYTNECNVKVSNILGLNLRKDE